MIQGYQAWEGPGPTLALLCTFEEVATDARWSVYARATDRCGGERTLMSPRVSAGESLELPEPDDPLVLVRFEPDPRPWVDRLIGVPDFQRNLLHARLDGVVYRVTEGLAGGPLVVGSSEDESVLFDAAPARSISFDRTAELEIVEIPITGRESDRALPTRTLDR
ncbi:MAG: hypothetical protein JWN68_1930 [Nocardioides sp.]|uniref:hypothetical protein n=1 Tax=Nocardioides sp. TaxID=35761 RepID=UPI0026256B88|nr:hypothetical protein [Nocardioides sp.]MCW2833977.1 hypothetical protein [Nocardioides sp.]